MVSFFFNSWTVLSIQSLLDKLSIEDKSFRKEVCSEVDQKKRIEIKMYGPERPIAYIPKTVRMVMEELMENIRNWCETSLIPTISTY